MTAAARARQVGWAVVLAACLALFLALTFHVNAVRNQVRLTERQIIAAERAKLMLETEFQTRASQQQLSDWNAVEFGYAAPRADQYLESQTKLASLGTPRGFGAPRPIRVALNRPATVEDPGLLGLLSEADSAPAQAAPAEAPAAAAQGAATSLAQRLARPAVGTVAMAGTGQ